MPNPPSAKKIKKIDVLPIVGISKPLEYQASGLQGRDKYNNFSITYSFDKHDELNYSSILRVQSDLAPNGIYFYNLPFEDYKITEQEQKACNILLHLPLVGQTCSTDCRNKRDYLTFRDALPKPEENFFIKVYHYHSKEPLSGVKLSYNQKEAISDNDGIATFSFELKSDREKFRIYPICIETSIYQTQNQMQYTCPIISCTSKDKAFQMALLKHGNVLFKDQKLVFDFREYELKEILIPQSRISRQRSMEISRDFFKGAFISSTQDKRHYIKIEKGYQSIGYITYKKELLTQYDIRFVIDEKDFKHLYSTLGSEDIDIYNFQDEENFSYLQEIIVQSSFEGRNATYGVDDTLVLSAKYSRNLMQGQQTQWGYLIFNIGVDILREINQLTKGGSVAIHRLQEFHLIENEEGAMQGEVIKIPFEWSDKQVLIFGYLSEPSLKHSVLIFPISQNHEEILIISLENSSSEEYIKFIFPENKIPKSKTIFECQEFMVENIVCGLKALSIEDNAMQEDIQQNHDSLKKYLYRFSRASDQHGIREVEYEEELDRFFAYATRNVQNITSKINQNKSRVQEAFLDNGIRVIRSKVYREFNKVEQKFLDESNLIQFDGKTIAQRTHVLNLSGISLQNMKEGKAPLGKDGKIVELHHLQQKEDGILIELTYTEHRENSRALHGYKKESEIDRKNFARFKKKYWKSRIEGID